MPLMRKQECFVPPITDSSACSSEYTYLSVDYHLLKSDVVYSGRSWLMFQITCFLHLQGEYGSNKFLLNITETRLHAVTSHTIVIFTILSWECEIAHFPDVFSGIIIINFSPNMASPSFTLFLHKVAFYITHIML